MQPWQAEGRLDQMNSTEADLSFRGVYERGSPADLPPGFVHRAKNKRFREGAAATRLGIQVLPCGKTDGATPWTEPLGATMFYDTTDKLRWIVVAAEGKIWRTRPNNVAQEVVLPAGVTLTAATFKQLLQTAGALILLRGETEDNLACTDLDNGFAAIPDPAGLLEPIPRSSFGMYLANRTLLIKNEYDLGVSEIGQYTDYLAVLNTFRINQGDYDVLVALGSYQEGVLICFKKNSVWKVTNFSGDVGANAVGPLLVTDQYGCVAPYSVVRAGSNLYWWSANGIASLAITDQNVIQSQENYLTDDMTYTMARINPAYVDKIRGVVFGGYLYFAVPLDDAKLYGPFLVPEAQSYNTGAPVVDPITGVTVAYYQLAVTSGAKYRYTQAVGDDIYLLNGSEKYYGPIEFTAAGSTVQFYGSYASPVEAQLELITAEGVLNGVLVYDLNKQAWAGTDEGEPVQIVDWLKVEIQGQTQLCFLGNDGLLHWYGIGYEDEIRQEVAVPYAEIGIMAGVTAGETVQVNGGTLVTAGSSQTVGGGWNTTGATFSDITKFALAVPSYNPAFLQWTAPDTTKVPVGIAESGNPGTGSGCRFLSTNGILPEVKINGVAITESGFYGANDWAYVELHSGSELTRIPIEDWVVSRGYQGPKVDSQRFQTMRGQIRTWNPQFTVKAIPDGVSEEATIQTETTFSRTRYRKPVDKAEWDSTNVNGDFATAYREDYSVLLPPAGMQVDPAGVNLETHQETRLNVPLAEVGNYLQLEIRNLSGRLELRQITLDSDPADETLGEKV